MDVRDWESHPAMHECYMNSAALRFKTIVACMHSINNAMYNAVWRHLTIDLLRSRSMLYNHAKGRIIECCNNYLPKWVALFIQAFSMTLFEHCLLCHFWTCQNKSRMLHLEIFRGFLLIIRLLSIWRSIFKKILDTKYCFYFSIIKFSRFENNSHF